MIKLFVLTLSVIIFLQSNFFKNAKYKILVNPSHLDSFS